MTTASGPDKSADELYDEQYFKNYYSPADAIPYERNAHWLTFFGMVADRVITLTEPTTALDVGCAMGFLVEAFRDRGVDASGTDVSSFAVSQAGGSAVGHCSVKSATEPIEGRYDLITCIEMIEHLAPADARVALQHMTDATDTLLLSTTPDDLEEPTHINVRPVEYWSELLAELGFHRDVDADTSFLTPWCGLFRRGNPTRPRIVRDYERSLYRFRREAAVLRNEVLVLHNTISDLQAARSTAQAIPKGADETLVELRAQLRAAVDATVAADAANGAAQAEARRLAVELDAARQQLAEIQTLLGSVNELSLAQDRLRAIEDSRTWRLTWKILAPYRKLRGRS